MEVVEGIDAAWLASAAVGDPVTHAYARWDLANEPDRVRFVSLRSHGATRAYLVVWSGTPGLPMVHWVGPTEGTEALLDALPERPFLAVVPTSMVDAVRTRRGPVREYAVEIRTLPSYRPLGPPRPDVRRLGREDVPALRGLVDETLGPLLEGYRTVDPERTPTFGAFASGRLVGVARASVTLPEVWVLTGIVVRPEHRGRGHGRAVTSEAARAARAAGAIPALYVRSDNGAAVRVYDRLGFVRRDLRAWLDVGAGREP